MNAPLSSIIAVAALGFATLVPIAAGFAQESQDAPKPAQSAVAAKDKKFTVVKADTDSVKKAIHATDLLAFKDKTGKEITIKSCLQNLAEDDFFLEIEFFPDENAPCLRQPLDNQGRWHQRVAGKMLCEMIFRQ